MKKIIFSFLFAFTFGFVATAQDNPVPQDEIHDDLAEMMDHLSKTMENMQSMLGDVHIMMDTVIFKSFGMMPGLEDLEKLEGLEGLEELEKLEELEGLEGLEQLGDLDLNLDKMFEMLNLQMSQLSKEDWSELGKMFEDFGRQFENLERKNSDKSKGLRKI